MLLLLLAARFDGSEGPERREGPGKKINDQTLLTHGQSTAVFVSR
jgi:hypothetical protein